MKKYRIEIKWAIIHAVIVLLWTAVERLSGLHDQYLEVQQNIAILLLIPTILVYVLAMLDKRKNVYEGSMSYVQGFLCGLGLTVGILALTPFVQFIASYIISPYYFDNLIAYSVSTGNASQEQAASRFTYPSFVFTNLVFQMITGVVFAAFIALGTKSDKKSDRSLNPKGENKKAAAVS